MAKPLQLNCICIEEARKGRPQIRATDAVSIYGWAHFEMLPLLDPGQRIEGFSVMSNFKMQGRPHNRTGITHGGNYFALFDTIPLDFEYLFQMGVDRIKMIAVIDDQHIAESFEPA